MLNARVMQSLLYGASSVATRAELILFNYKSSQYG